MFTSFSITLYSNIGIYYYNESKDITISPSETFRGVVNIWLPKGTYIIIGSIIFSSITNSCTREAGLYQPTKSEFINMANAYLGSNIWRSQTSAIITLENSEQIVMYGRVYGTNAVISTVTSNIMALKII